MPTTQSRSDASANPAIPPAVREATYVVMAAYQEASCVQRVASDISRLYPQVVVVDDGSTDGTYAAACKGAKYVLRHDINRGQGAALQTGIEFALSRGAEYIVTFDADGQHYAEDIDVLLAPIVQGECDVVLGSRFMGETENLPISRRWLLRMGVLFTRIVNRTSLTDVHNGLRAFSKGAACQIDITADGMAHASEIIDLIRATGLQYQEAPVRIRYTSYSLAKGQSSTNALRIVFQYLVGRMLR